MLTKRYNGSFCNAIAAAGGLQGRVMWCDAEANLWQLCTREGVEDTITRCKAAGINTIIMDVKPLAGVVLYQSSIAPRLKDWGGKPYPQDYDLLRVTIEECRKQGLGIYAAVNVFAEGSQDRLDGPAYMNPDWQCVQYELDDSGKDRFVQVADSSAEHLAVFVNPAKPEPRNYELRVIDEIVSNYDVDGIILDRMRYPNIYSDFSDFSRSEFEKWLGADVGNWPYDIYRLKAGGQIERGKLFGQWLQWRAHVIQSFLSEVRRIVKQTKPHAKVGAYVGSWYKDYYGVGVNWASKGYKPAYDWAPSTYNEAGYADLVDFLCTGCYYEDATRSDAKARMASEDATVEAAGEESVRVTMDDTFVYGSLYVLQYANKPREFIKAVETLLSTTQGVMIFDLCYIRDYNWWSILKDIFNSPAKAPHEIEGLIEKIKDIRQAIDSAC